MKKSRKKPKLSIEELSSLKLSEKQMDKINGGNNGPITRPGGGDIPTGRAS